ncbi:MAG: TRAP transporter small permease [Deltaproteobacteria bacterium]|nr:TRAP transporter small permease [Deltaproteobacteria bacterium]
MKTHAMTDRGRNGRPGKKLAKEIRVEGVRSQGPQAARSLLDLLRVELPSPALRPLAQATATLRGRGFPEDSASISHELDPGRPSSRRAPMDRIPARPVLRSWLNCRLDDIGLLAALAILLATLVIVEQVGGAVRASETAHHLAGGVSPCTCSIAATFVGAAYGLKQNSHINIELLHRPPAARRPSAGSTSFTSVIALGFCAYLAWKGAVMWWEAYEGGWRTSSLWSIPLVYPYAHHPSGHGAHLAPVRGEDRRPTERSHSAMAAVPPHAP